MNSKQILLTNQIKELREKIKDLVQDVRDLEFCNHGEFHGNLKLVKISETNFEIGLLALEKSVQISKNYIAVEEPPSIWDN